MDGEQCFMGEWEGFNVKHEGYSNTLVISKEYENEWNEMPESVRKSVMHIIKQNEKESMKKIIGELIEEQMECTYDEELKEEDGWFKVKDKPPNKENKIYLVSNGDAAFCRITGFTNGKFDCDDDIFPAIYYKELDL